MAIKPQSGNGQNLVRISVATILGTAGLYGYAPMLQAAEAADQQLEEVQVTGSRIVRRDEESNSPLVTVERAKLDENTYTSIEQTLNEMPEFMAGGAGYGAAAVTGLTAMGDVAGGSGTGNMFDMARLPDNGRIGAFVPGSATINLRGLGTNRSLTLIDGHRGVPSTGSGVIDLNTIPNAAIASIEVISGGASAVYGADALAGVTNIKLRNNFEGLNVRARYGINEVGDGQEYQVSALMGASLGDRGNAMVGIEYTKRDISYWENRDFFVEAMESPYSGSGNYIFGWHPQFSTGPANPAGACTTAGTGCTTTSNVRTTFSNFQNNQWTGNSPTQNAVNSVFADRTCGTTINCVTPSGAGFGFSFNPGTGTIFTRGSSATVNSVNTFYGPQGFEGTLGGTKENPDEVTCTYLANQVNQAPGFAGQSCQPTLNRVDWGRWLTSPREAYNIFGNATYDINDSVTAFSTVMFSQSQTQTRREPAPALGGWTAAIPYHSNPNVKYLASVAQTARPGVAIGDTLPEYRVGGARGTNCAPVGGCTMQQAFPVPTELRTLLNSRPDILRSGAPSATNPFGGLTVCDLKTIDSNAGVPGHTTQVPAGGGRPAHTVQMDPNTGETFKICGPDSAWRLAQTLSFTPPRGTTNTTLNWQINAGLRGDLPLGDWTWELFLSEGEARTTTEFEGFVSTVNYLKILGAPNYGMGFREPATGTATGQKLLTCTSGLSPFRSGPISDDCIAALISDQIDRQLMKQGVYEANFQGGLFELPAGETRAAIGFSYRNNAYSFTPDALHDIDYVGDISPGAFGASPLDEKVSVKEVYGELLVPLLSDLPAINKLELELGGRWSEYSTGQGVPTWKTLLNWEPLSWLRVRGGYNRAERAPNIIELFSEPSGSAQLTGGGVDPCRTDVGANPVFPGPSATNDPSNPNRAQLQALCSANINAWGGNNVSVYHTDPNNFTQAGGTSVTVGNPDLESEIGQTWTLGLVINSPFQHPLASSMSLTLDWYEVRVDEPIEVRGAQSLVNACFNVDGSNPSYSLNDPGGFCQQIERNPDSGAPQRFLVPYDNYGVIYIKGIDLFYNWSSDLSNIWGLDDAPGRLSLSLGANYLIDQRQALTAGGVLADYAGFTGASELRSNTSLSYTWGGVNRVGLTWIYRKGTDTPQQTTTPPITLVPSTTFEGYPSSSLFNLSAGTRIGPVNATLSVSNLFDTEPSAAGYNLSDPYNGLGTFDPFGDSVGRRYSLSLSMDF